jgi:hypothetical protein
MNKDGELFCDCINKASKKKKKKNKKYKNKPAEAKLPVR